MRIYNISDRALDNALTNDYQVCIGENPKSSLSMSKRPKA